MKSGRFLVATRGLTGPFFAKTVVLLLDYRPENAGPAEAPPGSTEPPGHRRGGAWGIIVNRPTRIPLASLLPRYVSTRKQADKIYVGGPVDPRTMLFLLRAAEAPPESQQIIDGVHVTGSGESLLQIIAKDPPTSHFRAFAGYAGWSPGQLEGEIRRGDWHVTNASADAIFASDPRRVWNELVAEHEGLQVFDPMQVPATFAVRSPLDR
ncbi:MAG: YqgE/AlgH family protein [Deltaproteobacteria bacterium]|nr:YqgE/AlgH family protein [Deltaproteobacteria bacterium]MBW2361939.1 YqgE/AlgH family protein [Deltaproteobacteria bacterium]